MGVETTTHLRVIYMFKENILIEKNNKLQLFFQMDEKYSITSQFQPFKTNKNIEFHHSSKIDNTVYTIY